MLTAVFFIFPAIAHSLDAGALFNSIISENKQIKTDNMTNYYIQQIEKWGFRWSPNLPEKRDQLYQIDGNWKELGKNHVDYFKKIQGKETVLVGFQRQNIQYVESFFKFNQSHPYCYWFVRIKDSLSHGRCDRNNDGYYEHDFNNVRKKTMKIKKWNWKKYWTKKESRNE